MRDAVDVLASIPAFAGMTLCAVAAPIHGPSLGLDPRVSSRLTRIVQAECGPRIKSEGSTVDLESIVAPITPLPASPVKGEG